MLRAPLTGLLIGMAATAATPSTPVTFNKDVLPVLQKNCQTCHRPGEVAPMSLLTYAEARPWAKAIKAAVLTKKMPPWFADPKVGHFSNDRSMNDHDRNILAAWADSGAVEGNAKDKPPAIEWAEGWTIGKPDIIVEMPEEVQIPATGVFRYPGVFVKVNFPKDMWVVAAEVRPGNRQVVHHMKAWVQYPRPAGQAAPAQPAAGQRRGGGGGGDDRPGRDMLAKYNPGLDGQYFTVGDAAKFIPAGSDIYFETHYTPNGKATTDRSKVGIVLAKEPPKHRFYTSGSLTNQSFTIPAGNPNWELKTEIPIEDNVELTWIQPHMHMRGKDFEVKAIYPTGETQTVLKVDGFNFNWQVGYEFAKPIPLPKGTKLISIAHYDNSANNPYNPDPTRAVPYGSQTSDEMSVAFFSVVVDTKADLTKLFGKASALMDYSRLSSTSVRFAASLILGLALCAILAVPYSRAQSVPAGKDVFEAQCLSCHNADSTEAKDGPGLKGIKDGKLPSGARATHDTVLEILDKGRQIMPSFKESLSSQQKEDVIAYVLTL